MSEKRLERPDSVSTRQRRKLYGALFGALLAFSKPAEAKMYGSSSDSASPRIEYAEQRPVDGFVPLDTLRGYQHIEGLEYSADNPLTVQRIESKIAELRIWLRASKDFLSDLERTVPTHSPLFQKMQTVVSYYEHMADKLTAVLAQKRALTVRLGSTRRHEDYIKEGSLRAIIAQRVRAADGRTLSSADEKTIIDMYAQARAEFGRALPGSVYIEIFSGNNVGAWVWAPLEQKVKMKEGVRNELPLSTARTVYLLWQQLERYRTYIDLANNGGAPLSDIRVTEGWHEGMRKNAGVHRGVAHREGSAVDLSFGDRTYTARRVAYVLWAAHNTPNCDMYFETVMSPDVPNETTTAPNRQNIEAALVSVILADYDFNTNHSTLSASERRDFAEQVAGIIARKYVRQVRHSTAPYHFHMEAGPRPVYAPESRVAGV